MAEKSGIPLWIIDGQAELRFSTVADAKLGEKKNIQKFLSSFIGAEAAPRIKKFDSQELYGSFSFSDGGEELTLIAGPAYEVHPYAGGGKGAGYILFRAESIKEVLLLLNTVSLSGFSRLLAVLAEICTKTAYEPRMLEKKLEKCTLSACTDGLPEILFENRQEVRKTLYAPEIESKLLTYVARGNVDAVRNFKLPQVKATDAKGTHDQNLFEAVALVALATRAAVTGGLDYAEAFNVNNLYFKKLSRVTNDEDFIPLLSEILLHFAQRVKEASRRAPLEQTSPYIKRSVKYILLHLHSPIRLEEVSREVGLEPKYFSRLFVSLTGETFSSFVQRERVLEAKELLGNNDRTMAEISNALGFSSPSYFIKVFNRYVGETPGMYAEKKRRRNDQSEEKEKL